jgi:hypothetical protein
MALVIDACTPEQKPLTASQFRNTFQTGAEYARRFHLNVDVEWLSVLGNALLNKL